MAGNEGKIAQQPKKTKPEAHTESPIKHKADINSTLDMILKKLAEVHDLARSTKQTTDTIQLELAAFTADNHAANNRLSEVEQRVSDIEDGESGPSY